MSQPQWHPRNKNEQWQWFLHDVWGAVAILQYDGQHQALFQKLLSAMKMEHRISQREQIKLFISHGQGPWGMWQHNGLYWFHLYDLDELCHNTQYKKHLWNMIQKHRLDGR